MNRHQTKRFMNGYDEYVVKQGDSLYQIAKLFNTTVADISDANMLTSSTIYPGQVLLIPKAGMQQFTVFEDYRTVEGDTIVGIAQKTGTTPALLGTYNDFGALKLEKNQVVKIPRRGSTYQIVEGDTVSRIINQTGKTAQELLELNASNWLKKGATIRIT
ncbi:MAG: LysM peptidoglycan-binding domain-containing protein [Bacilli bacterium]|jgi:LysM repeat protein|nr:LysM peptidoglycan-binding domain-containing protein [Bacilli bacterium]HHU24521.1 LysM peptidoglycan-binding domain-containing protein [Acholeplasmataceae bacterium]